MVRRGNRGAPVAVAAWWLVLVSGAHAEEPVGHFFRNVSNRAPTSVAATVPLPQHLVSALEGVSNYRLVPGTFPRGVDYHFDGLASVARFTFQKDGSVEYTVRAFESRAYTGYEQCDFYASGTGPTSPFSLPCLTNPVVNLLPLDGQLWLTIDTRFWGRMDPHTLDTLPDKVKVPADVLNAHPACDPVGNGKEGTRQCYVAYGCGYSPIDTQACIATLVTGRGRNGHVLSVEEVSRSPPLPHTKPLLHSHSPALTASQVIVKLESFTPRGAEAGRGGVLKRMHQMEDNAFLVMDRATNVSRLLSSGPLRFVNNHFWNAYDDHTAGGSIVDSVPATGVYLDTYFRSSLSQPMPQWLSLMQPPQRCLVPFAHNTDAQDVVCKELLSPPSEEGISVEGIKIELLDYPTFNPKVKARHYRFFYAIAPRSLHTSRWFDAVVKVEADSGAVVAQWGSEGVYVTEADFVPLSSPSSSDHQGVPLFFSSPSADPQGLNSDFVPLSSPSSSADHQGSDSSSADRGEGGGAEDDGVLLTVTYDSATDVSSLLVLSAVDLSLQAAYPLPGEPLSFHAHGIVCDKITCYTNP